MADDENAEEERLSLRDESSEIKNTIKEIRGSAPGSEETAEEEGMSRRRVLQVLGVASAGVFAGATGLYSNPALLEKNSRKTSSPGPDVQQVSGAFSQNSFISKQNPQSNDAFEPDIYVDPVEGNDRLYGQKSQPVETLREGIKKAKSGDSILLKEGINKVNRPVLLDKQVKIKVEEGSKFTINASEVNQTGFGGLRAALVVANSENVIIDGSPGRIEVKNCSEPGIAITNSKDFQLRGISLHSNRDNGLEIHGESSGLVEFCSASENSSEKNQCHGFKLNEVSSSEKVRFKECMARHNSGDGFYFVNSDGIQVDRSVSYRNKRLKGQYLGSGFNVEKCSKTALNRCIAYENVEKGIKWSKGSLKITNFTGFRNSRETLGPKSDIHVENPLEGSIENSIFEKITGNFSLLDMNNNVTKPVRNWNIMTETDEKGHPVDPDSFGKPK